MSLFRRCGSFVSISAALLLMTGSCSGDSQITFTPAVTPSGTATTAPGVTPVATLPPSPPGSAAGTPTSGAADSSGTAEPLVGDLPGAPFSTADVRAAVESAGRVFFVDDSREPMCPSATVREVTFWAASAGGTDYGPNWALWIYPDTDALEADWDVSGGKVRARTPCDLPTGWTYWNSNAVLTFVTWSGVSGDVPNDPLRSPGDDAVPKAFLAMSP